MKTITIVQLIFEVFVIVGFLVGLIPFGYLISVWWVLPLTILNLVLAIVSKNKTLGFTITNIFMAIFSLVPIIGYLTRIVGIIMSIISITKISKK